MNKTTRKTIIKSLLAACAIACAGFTQRAEAAVVSASVNNANYIQVKRLVNVSGATTYRLYRNMVNNFNTAKVVYTGKATTVLDPTVALGYKYYYWLAYQKGGKWYAYKTSPDWGARHLTLKVTRTTSGSRVYVKASVNGYWVNIPWTSTLGNKNVCGWTWYKSNPYIGYITGKKRGSFKVTVNKASDGKYMICHAMGGIDGNDYSNSLEAFKHNYAKGHRYFEVDFQYTSDGKVDGLRGRIDMDLAVFDYPTYMKENHLNGY